MHRWLTAVAVLAALAAAVAISAQQSPPPLQPPQPPAGPTPMPAVLRSYTPVTAGPPAQPARTATG